MPRLTEPWDLLVDLPERGWVVLQTRRRLSLLQLAAFGLVAVEVVAPGLYQVRLTAAGRIYRRGLGENVDSPEPLGQDRRFSPLRPYRGG